ncbi:unnamed protein product [Leptosia nina]|uniref:Uncharacterized protein n=1 Tax=Leptosia nina TaxID=320188 RepID=A0AAV1J1L5_9NEOP
MPQGSPFVIFLITQQVLDIFVPVVISYLTSSIIGISVTIPLIHIDLTPGPHVLEAIALCPQPIAFRSSGVEVSVT